MENFKPFLLAGLRNKAEYQVCHAAVGLVGDLARSLQSYITPHANDIMTVMFENLTVSGSCHSICLIYYQNLVKKYLCLNVCVYNVRLYQLT